MSCQLIFCIVVEFEKVNFSQFEEFLMILNHLLKRLENNANEENVKSDGRLSFGIKKCQKTSIYLPFYFAIL